MIKTTAMLHDELRRYANPAAKISRMMDSGQLTPLIKGLYETDASVPGHYLAGVLYGPSYLSFEFALAWHGLIPEAVYSYTSATCGKGRMKRYDTAFGTALRLVGHDMKVTDYLDTGHLNYQVPPGWWVDNN